MSLLDETGLAVAFEAEGVIRDGRTFWMSLNARVNQDPNQGEVIDGSVIDISARIERGEAERRRQIAEERQPGQERVPRQHEPRDPHADERRPRHDRAAARHGARPPSSASTLETVRRSARRAARRSSTTSSTSRRSRPASSSSSERRFDLARARRGRRSSMLAPQAAREGPRADVPRVDPTCPTRVRGDAAAPAPGPDQPGRQRHQVHRARRGRVLRQRAGRRATDAPARCCGSRCSDTGIGIAAEQQTRCSSRSRRRTPPPPGASAAPASAWRSAAAGRADGRRDHRFDRRSAKAAVLRSTRASSVRSRNDVRVRSRYSSAQRRYSARPAHPVGGRQSDQPATRARIPAAQRCHHRYRRNGSARHRPRAGAKLRRDSDGHPHAGSRRAAPRHGPFARRDSRCPSSRSRPTRWRNAVLLR